jgi:hypothetical protein
MKYIQSVLLVISMALGLLGAASAYVVPLDLPASEIEGLTLAAPAVAATSAANVPVAPSGTEVTPVLLRKLLANRVKIIRVTSFSIRRWPGKRPFFLGCAGLLVGAFLTNFFKRKQRALTREDLEANIRSPGAILEAVRTKLEHLRADERVTAHEAGKLDFVLDVLTRLQTNDLLEFLRWSGELTARFGITGYAEINAAFSAAERQINRAWSAAADGVKVEVLICLDRAIACITSAQNALGASESLDETTLPQR